MNLLSCHVCLGKQAPCEGGGGGGGGREGIDQESVRARGRGLDHWEARVIISVWCVWEATCEGEEEEEEEGSCESKADNWDSS
jgi:hypothetical protein